MKTLISMFTMRRFDPHPANAVYGDVYYYKDIYKDKWKAVYPYYPFNFRIKIKS